jgi:hypothetical protein
VKPMKNYKVNIDRTKPTSEEINAGKDFDKLLGMLPATAAVTAGAAAKKSFWKSGWGITTLAAATVAVATGVVLLFNTGGASDNTANNNGANGNNGVDNVRQPSANSVQTPGAFIAPPLAGVDVPFDTYRVKSEKGGKLDPSSGSHIIIPAGAFVDNAGNPVKGDVEVRYRELRDPVDFFVSGIPMHYDSAGTRYHFESAGMVEIAAFKDGKVVYLKPDKKVEIQLASDNSSTAFNLYKLDTNARNWSYLGKDKVTQEQNDNPLQLADQKIAAKKQETDAVIKGLETERDNKIATVVKTTVLPEKPLEPRKSDKTKNRFNVLFDTKEFPEMANFKDVVFEVDESQKPFDRGLYGIKWEDVQLLKGNKENTYIVSLKKGIRIEKIDVYPVLAGKNYDEAMKKFTSQMDSYNTALATRKQAEENLRQEYSKAINEQRAVYQKYQDAIRKEFQSQTVSSQTLRVFQVASFGVYNCDSPMSYPNGGVVNALFTDEQGKQLTCNSNVYLVEKGRDALFTYYKNPEAAFRFNPGAKNLIWTVSDGKLFTLMPDQFAGMPVSGDKDIVLKKVEQEFKTADEMRRYFGI